MTWEFHVNYSVKGRYYMILGRYLIKSLGLNLKKHEHIIKVGDGPLKGSTAPMIYFGTYRFKYLHTGKITPEESFMNSYIQEVFES